MEELISQLLASVQGIWKYRWQAVLVMWLLGIAGAARVASLPDEYQSTARVFVDTQSILKPLMSGMTSVPNVEQQVAIMSRTLLSRPNVERVMRMVDLDLRSNTLREHEQRVDSLMAKIKINGTSTYDIYTLTYTDRDPKLARDIVQSLLTIFVEGSFQGKRGDSEKAVQFIDEQIRNYEARLVAAENLLKEFKLKNAGLLPRAGIDYSAQLAMAADALNTAKLDLLEAERARASIRAQTTGEEPVLFTDKPATLIYNPEIDARIASINKNLDSLLLQYTELHPDIIAARRLLAQLDARKVAEAKLHKDDGDPGKNYSPMLQQLKIALAEADAKVAGLTARVQEYTARHQRLQALSNAVPELESQLAQLNRDYLINKDNYEKLVARREAAKLSGDLSTTTEMMSFKIIDPPTLPAAPIGPNRPLLYGIVFLVALLAGPAYALLLSQVRPTFLSPGMMREVTGLTVLGTVAMNWTAPEKVKYRRGQWLLGLSIGALAVLFGVLVLSGLLRP